MRNESIRILQGLACAALLGGLLLPPARADEWNKEVLVTIKKPLQVPGVVLQPGEYIFRLEDSQSNRHIVRIYNREQTHLYQTAQALPNYRIVPSSEAKVLLEERAIGHPDAIRAVFFPGDNYGQEFVYPPEPAQVAISVTTKHPVVAAAMPAPTPEPAPQPEAQPAPAPPPHEVAQAQPQPQPQPPPLPKTASNQPLIALAGLLSLAAAFGLRLLRRQT